MLGQAGAERAACSNLPQILLQTATGFNRSVLKGQRASTNPHNVLKLLRLFTERAVIGKNTIFAQNAKLRMALCMEGAVDAWGASPDSSESWHRRHSLSFDETLPSKRTKNYIGLIEQPE